MSKQKNITDPRLGRKTVIEISEKNRLIIGPYGKQVILIKDNTEIAFKDDGFNKMVNAIDKDRATSVRNYSEETKQLPKAAQILVMECLEKLESKKTDVFYARLGNDFFMEIKRTNGILDVTFRPVYDKTLGIRYMDRKPNFQGIADPLLDFIKKAESKRLSLSFLDAPVRDIEKVLKEKSETDEYHLEMIYRMFR